MTFAQLHAALLRLADRFALATGYGFYDRTHQNRRAEIESVAHELAHGIDLARRPLSSQTIRAVVGELSDQAADRHEMRAQRVEALGLRAFGVRISAQRLAGVTEWRCGIDPPYALVTAPLSKREQRGVAMFVAILLREAEAP